MASPVSSNALSELIGSIYDCALDPDLWDKTLASVVEALKARTTVLHLNDLRHRRFLISKQFGIPPYWQENLHKYASELDSVVSSVISSQAPGKPCVMSRHFAQAQLEASPYYNECLKPEGIVDLMQFVLLSTPTRRLGAHARGALFKKSASHLNRARARISTLKQDLRRSYSVVGESRGKHLVGEPGELLAWTAAASGVAGRKKVGNSAVWLRKQFSQASEMTETDIEIYFTPGAFGSAMDADRASILVMGATALA